MKPVKKQLSEEKTRNYSKEELEQMFALGEITKTEYEKMKSRLGDGESTSQ